MKKWTAWWVVCLGLVVLAGCSASGGGGGSSGGISGLSTPGQVPVATPSN